MNRDDKVEFTPDGFQKAIDSLDFLPIEQREAAFRNIILVYMTA